MCPTDASIICLFLVVFFMWLLFNGTTNKVEYIYSVIIEFRLSNTRDHPYKLFKRRCSNATRSVCFFQSV